MERVRDRFCPRWALRGMRVLSGPLSVRRAGYRVQIGGYVGMREMYLRSAHCGKEESPRQAPYLQQCGRPGAVAKVFDNGDVASQAPVHAAALVTHQHTPADGGPARVCGGGGRCQP